MATQGSHHLPVYQSHTREQGTHHRQLKHHSHHQRKAEHSVNIRLQRQHVVHLLTYLISAEETYREGEDDKIAYQHTDDKHHIPESRQPYHITALTGMQRRRHEAEHLKQHPGGCHEQSHTQRRADVYEELFCQSGIHQM